MILFLYIQKRTVRAEANIHGENITEPVIKYAQSEKQALLRCIASLHCQERSHILNEKYLKHHQMEVGFIN